MRRALLLILVFLVGAGAGVAAAYSRWHIPRHRMLTQQRAMKIEHARNMALARAMDAPPGAVVAVGDSVTERQDLTTLCGRPALNAGVSGARLDEIAAMAQQVIAETKPTRVVIETGPNDFLAPNYRPTPLPVFRAEFERMLQVAGPRPIVAGMTLPTNAPASAVEANQLMRQLAVQDGGYFFEGLPAQLTLDWLHPSPAGAKEWRRRVEAYC